MQKPNNSIQHWSLRFLKWFCRPDLHPYLEGDLLELHHERIQQFGDRQANRKMVKDVLLLFRPGIIRPLFKSSRFNTTMLRHSVLISFRNFQRQKSSFLINTIGLTSGLACALLIFLWVNNELSVDKFHKNDPQLYHLMSNISDASGVNTWKGVPGLMLEEIQETIPEVELATASNDTHEYSLAVNDNFFKASGKFVSQDFLKVFTYELLSPAANVDFGKKDGIVITSSLAMKLFGTTDVLGRQIDWHSWGRIKSMQVTGILKDLPDTASERFDFLMSWNYWHDDLISFKNWGNYYGRIDVVLQPEASIPDLNSKLTEIVQAKQENDRTEIFLTSYSGRYLYGKYENGKIAGGRIEYVNLFTLVAIFILFIACINYINLATAKAANRFKEAGIKKSIGASRFSVALQYLVESNLIVFFSLLIALALVWMFLPQFNLITQKQISLDFNLNLVMIAGLFVFAVGILSGIYPALYMSNLKVNRLIRGNVLGSGKIRTPWGRNVLVILQFTISTVLIVGVIVVYFQMDLIQNRHLGYNRNNVVYFEREGALLEKDNQPFLDALKQQPGVQDAAVSGFMVGGGNSTGGVSWPGKTQDDQIQFWETRSGTGLLDLLEIEIVQGRDFSEDFPSDTGAIIFNEAAIEAMGMKDPIGVVVNHYRGDKKIIGVVKDFNLISLHTAVEPMLFLYEPSSTHFVMVKLESGRELDGLERVGEVYESFNPGYLYEPRFVDEDYQAMYTAEMRISVLSKYFAGFAILITCLGLFGLASFTMERRTKEIGVRKILGSSDLGIVQLLSSEFSILILVAMVFAIPLSYVISNQWLQNFAYQIDLDWWIFVVGPVIILMVSGATVLVQAYKAAVSTSVDSLRNE